MVSEVRRLHSTEQKARLSLVLGNPSSESIARLSVRMISVLACAFLLIATLSKVYVDWLPCGIPSMFKARKDSLEPKKYSHNAHHNEAPLASKMLLSLYYFGL